MSSASPDDVGDYRPVRGPGWERDDVRRRGDELRVAAGQPLPGCREAARIGLHADNRRPGSADPVGQGLEGVRRLINRYRRAGITSIAHDFYPGGRHEMLHELNRREVVRNLLTWTSSVLKE